MSRSIVINRCPLSAVMLIAIPRRCCIAALELHLQLRFLSSARFTMPARRTENGSAQLALPVASQFYEVISGLVRRKLITHHPRRWDLSDFATRSFKPTRPVTAVVLLRATETCSAQDVQRHILEREPVELRIDGEQVDAAPAFSLDVIQIAVGFVADHVRQRGTRVDPGRYAAPPSPSKASA